MTETPLLIAAFALALVSFVCCVASFVLRHRAEGQGAHGADARASAAEAAVAAAVDAAQRVAAEQGQRQASELSAMLERELVRGLELQRADAERTSDAVARLTDQMARLRAETARSMETSRAQAAHDLERVRVENARSAEAMRATVGEKLDVTLGERLTQSFAQVDARLQQVDAGLGEMRGLAAGVGDLKRVLSNVKTRGIVGEVQLGAILREVLAPSQYAENVATVPGRSERVEYAVRIPAEGGRTVWLPIDAKFPGDAYEHLRAAEETGDAAAVEAAWRALEARLRAEAADIRDKYLAPPDTTTFGVLFLPFEGLYAAVAGRPGLLERLQREGRVSVAGPSTMAALLNALEMGFQAVAVQRRADDIRRVLVEVRTEFGRYRAELERAQRQLATASRTVESLVTTRTRAMERKLADVTALDVTDDGEPGHVQGAPTPPASDPAAASRAGAHFRQGD